MKSLHLILVINVAMTSCNHCKRRHEAVAELLLGRLTLKERKTLKRTCAPGIVIINAKWTQRKSAQRELLPHLAKGRFKNLAAFVDTEGIIKIGGRMDDKNY